MVKGSQIRKRYVLVIADTEDRLNLGLKSVFGKFGSRTKYTDRLFAVVLTDQIQKEALCKYVDSMIPGMNVVTVSGTIRKCKEIIKSREKAPGTGQAEA